MAERKRILAVDDDVPAVSSLRQILAQKGYDVQTATSGEAALELIERESYDLFILDVNMPGVNGLEVCRKIRETPKTADTPVIFLTAKGMLGDMIEGKEAGSDLYLVKPVLGAKILNMVAMFLSNEGPLAKKSKRATG
jgi:DNA-binding response OmpR family regulator